MCSILIAIKFFDDTFCTNSYYARIGGIQTKEMNHLEMEFLKGVNFSLLVSCADYHKYHNELYLHAHNGLCHLCCCIRWEIWSRPQSSSVFVLFRAQQDFDLFFGEKCDEFASEYRRCLQNFVVGELCILCGTREWMDWWLEDWVDLFKWMEGAWRVSREWVESEWRVSREWMEGEWRDEWRVNGEWMESEWIR